MALVINAQLASFGVPAQRGGAMGCFAACGRKEDMGTDSGVSAPGATKTRRGPGRYLEARHFWGDKPYRLRKAMPKVLALE